MSQADRLYRELNSYIRQVERNFLAKHLKNPLASPKIYDYPVSAYSVLCHSGFEEYFEQISHAALNHSMALWANKQRTNQCLLSLIAHYPTENKKLKKRGGTLTDKFLGARLNEAKSKFEYDVRNNHGAGRQYIEKLLGPVGIDVTSNTIWHASLESLVTYRGEVAHTRHTTFIRSPNDVNTWINDCLLLCDDVRKQTNKILSSR